MSDLRDQLRKAGLISDKQLRQAKHKERVHASQVGREGIEAERAAKEERQHAEREARRKADRERERRRQRERAEQERAASRRLEQTIRGGWIREATTGSRRFFVETRTGRITYLDLSDTVARRLTTGSAAIVETQGVIRGELCVVTGAAAAEIRKIRPEIIRFWKPGGSEQPAR